MSSSKFLSKVTLTKNLPDVFFATGLIDFQVNIQILDDSLIFYVICFTQCNLSFVDNKVLVLIFDFLPNSFINMN